MQYIPNRFYQNLFFILFLFLITPNLFANVRFHHSDEALKAETRRNIANDKVRGEDLQIRKAAVSALGNRAGTVVVMHAQTGRIYTIVNQKWAIQDGFKPCSTIKLVTAVAGYNENLIRSNGTLSNGKYRLNLDQSLAYSNNIYFQKVGKYLGSKKMSSYARKLGLGRKTGINARNEYRGKLPYRNENLRIYSHADDFRVTPLQLAVMVSSVSNGGKILVPRIPNSNREKANFNGSFRNYLSIDENIYERVLPGMMGAVKYGTARRIQNANLNIAGKTGSCISRKTWVGLFASVAPIQNPKYSVVVILRGRYARGKYSAAIAEKVYRALRPRYNDNFNGNLAKVTNRTYSAPKELPKSRAANPEQIAKQPKRYVRKKKKVGRYTNPIRNTVISYRRTPTVAKKPTTIKKPKKKREVKAAVVNQSPGISRPRVVPDN